VNKPPILDRYGATYWSERYQLWVHASGLDQVAETDLLLMPADERERMVRHLEGHGNDEERTG